MVVYISRIKEPGGPGCGEISMKKVFIDGSAGTTGLRIFDRLQARSDIQLLTLPEAERKDEGRRRQLLNEADAAFLCLPDAAAEEAASWVENPDTVVLDTSTAHRTADGWTYGFPELTGQRENIRQSRRIANPGCHASGFIALVAPLVEKGMAKVRSHIRPWVTAVLAVFMAVNMLTSALALARYDARTSGEAPKNSIDTLLDAHFDDARMERIYPNAKKVAKAG